MLISFIKVSDEHHVVEVARSDGSTDRVELDSRSFLRHDLAHYAVEVELDLRSGVWGSVAAGGSLAGEGLDGNDMDLAESLAGPMQTMMRTAASADRIREVLQRVGPFDAAATDDLAQRLHERLRQLAGHWAATRYGDAMRLEFPIDRSDEASAGDAGKAVG